VDFITISKSSAIEKVFLENNLPIYFAFQKELNGERDVRKSANNKKLTGGKRGAGIRVIQI
jgi:hypothetical protein